jgi:hypothetical protein
LWHTHAVERENHHTATRVSNFGKPKGAFLKRHTLVCSITLLIALELIGHALWLRGIIPDNNTGGEVLYELLPLLWLICTLVLVLFKFLL